MRDRTDLSFLMKIVSSVVLILCVAVPSVGAAPHTPARDILGPGSTEQARYRDLAVRQLVGLGFPSSYVSTLRADAQASSARWMYAHTAPDVNGDGEPEVIESDNRWRVQTGPTGQLPLDDSSSTRITVRSGSTGKELWHEDFEGSAGGVGFRVGPKGRPGILVVRNLFEFVQGTSNWTLGFEAFSGRAGRPVWSRSYRTTMSVTPAGWASTNTPMTISRMNAFSGRADDLLLSFSTRAGSTRGSTTAARTLVIDGNTGVETVHPTIDVGVDFWPIPGKAGDLDGDGLDDVVVANMPAAPSGGGDDAPAVAESAVYARTGSTGLPIWTTAGLDLAFFGLVAALPDVAGSDAGEVNIDTVVGDDIHQYVLDGGSGAERWNGRGDWLHSPGDVDGDGEMDVVASHTTPHWKDGTATVTQRAFTGEGAPLWKREMVWDFEDVPCLDELCMGSLGTQQDFSADVEPDRVFETVAQLYVDGGDQKSYLFDGRTGRAALALNGPLHSPGVSMDGKGADLIHYTFGTAVQVHALTADGHALWRTRLDSADQASLRKMDVMTDGLSLRGDRCGDVVVNVFDRNNSFFGVIDGATGRVLWSRTSGPHDARLRFVGHADANTAC